MSLKEKITDDFKQAFKEKDLVKKSVLSSLRSEISNQEIANKQREVGLSDEDVLVVIKRAIKQRKDAVMQYKEGGRDDLAEKEAEELKVLEGYMPEQMSEEEVDAEVQKIIREMGVKEKSEMGKVMGAVMARLQGKADGSLVKKSVEKQLS